MPKGQQQKIKGAICNTPAISSVMNNVLPQAMDSNGLILVKLEKKLIFSGHVLFENVNPYFAKSTLEYLKSVNPFYSKVLINMYNISKVVLSLADIDAIIDHDCFPITNDNSSNDDSDVEGGNPLNTQRADSDEMCLIPNIILIKEISTRKATLLNHYRLVLHSCSYFQMENLAITDSSFPFTYVLCLSHKLLLSSSEKLNKHPRFR